MPIYTRTILYLGNRADSDPLEGACNAGTENPNALLGSFNISDGLQLTSVNFCDNSGLSIQGCGPNGTIEENYTYYSDTGGLIDSSTLDRLSYDIGSGNQTTTLDNAQEAISVTATLADGSTVQLNKLVIIQATNGDVFLMESTKTEACPPDPAYSRLDNLNIQSVNVNSIDSTFYYGIEIPPDITNSQVVCFSSCTMLETDCGPVAIEDIQVGDLVQTRDNGLQPVRWIGSRKISAEDLTTQENLRPIRIRAGALGAETPQRDLLLSPQHRVLINSKIAARVFGDTEVLVAAKHLCDHDGIEVATDVQEVKYFHVLFDRHEIVMSNGAATESLFTGPEAMKGVSPAAREEIFTLFPELLDHDYTPIGARQLVKGRKGRQLVSRHVKNRKPLVAEGKPPVSYGSA